MIPPWTPEQIETLLKLCAEGLSARDIGLAIGRPRNGVIGKLYRLRMSRATTLALANIDYVPIAPPPVVVSIEPLLALPDRKIGTCAEDSCTNTRQPGRSYCADHLRQAMPKNKRAGQFQSFKSMGSSSLL